MGNFGDFPVPLRAWGGVVAPFGMYGGLCKSLQGTCRGFRGPMGPSWYLFGPVGRFGDLWGT